MITILSGDSVTRFGKHPPKVGVVREIESGVDTMLRAPADIEAWLGVRSDSLANRKSGATSELPLMKLLDRVCRRILRQFAIREGADDEASTILRDPLWPTLYELLDDAGRIVRFNRQMGGPPASLIRVINPKGLLKPSKADRSSAKLRRKIFEIAREISK